jgi:hypothetical protein
MHGHVHDGPVQVEQLGSRDVRVALPLEQLLSKITESLCMMKRTNESVRDAGVGRSAAAAKQKMSGAGELDAEDRKFGLNDSSHCCI